MKWPTLKCPFCGGVLPNSELWPNRPMTCPSCSKELQLEKRQGYISASMALGLTVLLTHLGLGVSGAWLIPCAVLLWIPVFVIWEYIGAFIFPTRFEPYGGKTSGKNDAGHKLLGR